MSYKFEIHRCTDCGAVWFGPDNTNERQCGLVYESPSGVFISCRGTVNRYAGFDSDSFSYMVPGWDFPSVLEQRQPQISHFEKFRDSVQRLEKLLKDDERGLYTWNAMVVELTQEIVAEARKLRMVK